jgi:hypothetical protein
MPRPDRGANKGVKSKKRRAVFKLYGRRCAACRKRIAFARMQVDHIRARSEGGTDHISNLQSLCENCHKFKHGWDGRISYWRLFKCGCTVSVIRRGVSVSRRVVRYLKITPPAPPTRGQWISCCEKHSRLPDTDWRKLRAIRYHPKLPALPRSRFERFLFCKKDPLSRKRRVSDVLGRTKNVLIDGRWAN